MPDDALDLEMLRKAAQALLDAGGTPKTYMVTDHPGVVLKLITEVERLKGECKRLRALNETVFRHKAEDVAAAYEQAAKVADRASLLAGAAGWHDEAKRHADNAAAIRGLKDA